ncbi:hypothetical protein [Nocardiopsis oceani]
MPKMLTVDEQFEAIIAGAEITAKMSPLRDPDGGEQPAPSEEKPAESAPAEEKSGDDK